MSKEKKPTDKKKRGEYDEKLQVNGSFMDIMKAAVKNADANSKAKKTKPAHGKEYIDRGASGG